MPRRSNEFQKLVYLVKHQIADDEATVTESKLLVDRTTGAKREVDICIEQRVAGHSVIICIECRDHKRKASVQWVEEMKSKHERLGTHALVLVSRHGFSREAIKVAQGYSIETVALEEVDESVISDLLSSLLAKSFSLSPSRIIFRVEEIEDMRAEDVAVIPDTLIYGEDGTLLGTVWELIELLLRLEYVIKEVGAQAEESHKGFMLRWDNPSTGDGSRLCLQKEEPLMLRKVESIYIEGTAEVCISQFHLKHGAIAGTLISWGEGRFLGEEALLVTSKSEEGETKISVNFAAPKL
jgi:hypothetical protein